MGYQHFLDRPILTSKFNVLGTVVDTSGIEIIAMMEHKNYPIFAGMIHPEKSSFDFYSGYPKIRHTGKAIRFARYLSDRFVNLARKSTHRWKG